MNHIGEVEFCPSLKKEIGGCAELVLSEDEDANNWEKWWGGGKVVLVILSNFRHGEIEKQDGGEGDDES